MIEAPTSRDAYSLSCEVCWRFSCVDELMVRQSDTVVCDTWASLSPDLGFARGLKNMEKLTRP